MKTFTISETTIRNMYNSFSHGEKYEASFGGKDKEDGYKLATEIDFNAFKIYFRAELMQMGLDTTLS